MTSSLLFNITTFASLISIMYLIRTGSEESDDRSVGNALLAMFPTSGCLTTSIAWRS